MTRLLSVGPEAPSDDEQTIAKGYTSYAPHIIAFVALGLSYHYGTTKELILCGLVVMVFIGLFIEARLHDLCIRLRRANILLRNSHPTEAA